LVTRAHLQEHLDKLMLTFLHYSRMSGVTSLREATRLRFAGLQALARDSLLDTRDFDLNAIGRVLATYDETGKKGADGTKKDGGPSPEHAELRLEQFLQVRTSLCG